MLPIIKFCTISWESQIDKIHSLLKQAIQNISEGELYTMEQLLRGT